MTPGVPVRPTATAGSRRLDDDRDDHVLVVAARAGDRAAADRLLRRHQPRIHALCRRMCRDEADALDATQEALVALVRGLGRYDGRAQFSTWAYRVATNACLDELRRRGRRPQPVDDARLGGAEAGRRGVADDVADRLDIDAALGQVPEEFRVAVVLRDLCGLDYAEIAEVLGVPVGTVRSRIARGRARLAGLLAPEASP